MKADIIGKLDVIKFVPQNTYLVFLDFKSLSTNIITKRIIKAAKHLFDIYASKTVVKKAMATL